MESPTSHLVAKDFQVTGVSRSGRVRKKSSKLLDFESPEEIEKRTRRQSGGRQPSRYSGRGRPSNALRDLDLDQEMLVDEPNISDNEEFHPETPTTAVASTILNSDDELDNLVQDLVDGVQAEATNQESSVRQSLYMREKANKRKVLKDGKVVNSKAQRKDKGKQRYTAYSLWAREARKKELQDLDFTSATRRLSEMWSNVSNRDKNAWRRKAKIQASRARSRDRTGPNGTTQVASNGSTPIVDTPQHETIFQNRATTSRTRKLAADRQQSSIEAAAAAAAASTSSQRRSITTRSGRSPASTSTAKQQSFADGDVSSRTGGQQKQDELTGKTSIEVIDAAAHLKLLGESLTVIGERLKKHNGYVALSGSLSVLLDSLLCAMGPLLCMTTQIPGLENKAQLSKNLADTLDNIAYVMPGL
ncbi:HMG box-containing protein 4 [Drosophila eugracilis]|uniref:HMG box-containing protein 4 n=1 Tax=Drosophila eugracilis TaxID=29029 RepID=UPI0007E6E453|nr:HMG box-containing protein 4 [Drosophila eugracilis]